MGILDEEMSALCLFDIYRGVFTAEAHRVQSSSAASEVQAAAKLSLLTYLLNHEVSKMRQNSDATNDNRLKAFLGDLVIGIQQETVMDGKASSKDYNELPNGID